MNKLWASSIAALGCVLGAVGTATTAGAVSISIFDPGNSGIGSLSFSVSSTTITINETWTSSKNGFLQIDGLDGNVDYTVVKNITNNTGVGWTSLANELLDPDNGPGSNDDLDPKPYPGFVPPGFTTSNDFDGLSFAQGSGIPRTSNVWNQVVADESTDVRDFLDFKDGTLANGATGFVTYGLQDSRVLNEPFLLSQRPNAFSNPSVPEPSSTVSLLALGVLGVGSILKRKFQKK